jgi:membrane protease YdiL (CAAX protease family)
MRLTAHFDAGLAGLVLVAYYCRPARSWMEIRPAIAPTLVIALITTTIVTSLAWAIGYVRPDFKLPSFTGWHLAKILLWTCVLEDALARSSFVATRPSLRWLPLLATSALFGLAHAGGGPTFVALAALAGLGYGYAFQLTGRIEAAIAVHLVLNATRFIGFTYPNLSGVST